MTHALSYVSPEKLRDCWDGIKPGIDAVRESSEAWIAEDVYHAIRAGVSSLYLALVDNEYAGFVVLTSQQNYDGPQLFIWCCYSTRADYDPIDTFLPELKKIAEKIGAKRLLFGSQRRWERRLKDHGWMPYTTIYGLEL